MILIETADTSDAGRDAAAILAGRLAARGHAAALDERSFDAREVRTRCYDAAPFLCRLEDADIDRIVVIAADQRDEGAQPGLRALSAIPAAPAFAVGRFADRQAMLAARARLSHLLGREAAAVNLAELLPRPILPDAVLPLFALPPAAAPADRTGQRLLLSVPGSCLGTAAALSHVAALDAVAGLRLAIVTDPEGIERIAGTNLSTIPCLLTTELPPQALAASGSSLVVLGDELAGDRLAALALDMMRAGCPVVDCTRWGNLAGAGAPVLRGPREIAALPEYLRERVVPNRAQIERTIGRSTWLAGAAIERLEHALGIAPRPARAPASQRRRGALFLPTNGVGVGHARRLAEVAGAMRNRQDVRFAAFPSCVDLISRQGFDCRPLVARSEDHDAPYANDLLNHIRIGRLLERGDVLVFDGGYVFDSVYRAIRERGLRGVWVRRGLWQRHQSGSVPPERADAFGRIIVPAEAFDELNAPVAWDPRIHAVGPIVHRPGPQPGRQELREAIAGALGVTFERLVVTMLGGGVVADRTAQIQTICHLAGKRPDWLNLVVVWPGSPVDPRLYGWRNTRIVRTMNAATFCRAADLAISAAGYNSFHELLFHKVPTIFMPQMAPIMDDQERRARAASDRGLSRTVAAHELLLLERTLAELLDRAGTDDLRKCLDAAVLPEIGTEAAAALIDEELEG